MYILFYFNTSEGINFAFVLQFSIFFRYISKGTSKIPLKLSISQPHRSHNFDGRHTKIQAPATVLCHFFALCISLQPSRSQHSDLANSQSYGSWPSWLCHMSRRCFSTRTILYVTGIAPHTIHLHLLWKQMFLSVHESLYGMEEWRNRTRTEWAERPGRA